MDTKWVSECEEGYDIHLLRTLSVYEAFLQETDTYLRQGCPELCHNHWLNLTLTYITLLHNITFALSCIATVLGLL